MRKIVARSNQRPGKKDGSPKPTGAPASVDGAAASRNDEDRPRTLNWMLVTMGVLAAVSVALAGLGFSFLHDSKSALNASDASVATFVGSETCAGCHRAQAELWHASQHKHAMDHAKMVLGDFSDACFDHHGGEVALLSQGRQILRGNRRAGWQARCLRARTTQISLVVVKSDALARQR